MSQLYVDNIRNRTGGPIGIPTGAVVTGVLTATTGNITGNMTVGGVLTYEDVTNIDSVGLITARSGIEFGASGVGGTITATGQAEFVGVSTFSSDVSIADKIIHTGDTNTAIRFPAVDTFTVETIGTERFRITPTGLIGISSDGPTRNVDINNASGDTFISAKSQNTGFAGLLLGDQEADNRGQVTYDNNDDSMVIHTAQAERLRITSSGSVGIATTNPIVPLHVIGNQLFEGDMEVRPPSSGSEGGQITLKNPGGSTTGATIDITTDDSFRIFQLNNNSLMQFGQLSGTGGQITLHTAGSERLRVLDNGRVAIARTTSVNGGQLCLDYTNGVTAGLVVKDTQTTGTGIVLHVVNGSGSIIGGISQDQSNTSFNTSSDYRLKENIIDLDGAIDRVKQLAPKRFNFIANADTTVDGFLAHEAQTVVPEAVTGTHNEIDDDGNPVIQSIDHSKLVPLLTGALQEAIAKIESLEKRIKSLES